MEDTTQAQVMSVEPEKEPDYEFVDPKKIRLFRSDLGWLRLEVEGDRCYLDVKVVRAFPLSDPVHYYGLLNAKDKVIGLVANPSELEAGSRQIAEQELNRRYFTPIIQRITRMKEEHGVVYGDIETNLGLRQFVVKGIRDSILDLGDGRVLIMDVEGNRYMVKDWPSLDDKSRRLLERVL
jgi:hypothetical protein